MEILWWPRDLFGVPYENHINKHIFFFLPEPPVLMAQEKRKEEELIGWLVNSFTRGPRAVLGGETLDPRLGGLQARLASEAQPGFHRPFRVLLPTWMRPKGKTTTCFFINDAFCRVRLSTD